VEQIERAIYLAKSAGLEVTAHVIFGLPGETYETGLKTIKWLNRLSLDFLQAYCAVPWPSAPLYNIAKAKGWINTFDWQSYEQNFYIMDIGTIKPAEVEYLRRLSIRKFYLSPKRILNLLRKLNSIKKIKVFLKTIKEFLTWIS
jgi:radical SAM superfamily enzyme YgiQ (UPF0313 family)